MVINTLDNASQRLMGFLHYTKYLKRQCTHCKTRNGPKTLAKIIIIIFQLLNETKKAIYIP